MNYGFVRVASVTPNLRVADVEFNTNAIIDKINECAKKGVQLAVFPELCLTGYTLSDLFFQPILLDQAKSALSYILKKTKDAFVLAFVGLPYVLNDKIYNVSAVINAGKLLGFVAKRNLPNYNEFYEQRQFTAWRGDAPIEIEWENKSKVPFGGNLIFEANGFKNFSVGCEICEDGWVCEPPSTNLCKLGAKIIVNLSASNEVIGKREYRKTLFSAQSGRCLCGYVYSSSSIGESTTDTVYSGHDFIFENGSLLAESELFKEDHMIVSEIDVDKLAFERRKQTTFVPNTDKTGCIIPFDTMPFDGGLIRKFSKTPFVPTDKEELKERSELIISMQAHALAKRLKHTNAKNAVIGISGGLDSTLALLVTAKAFDIIGKARKEIIAVTMPGFGTTGRTYQNAVKMINCIGATFKEVNIVKGVLQHFEDIGHDKEVFDVTYENSQARMRTMILMNTANKYGGLVVGTGDLSELALGWCTYNGDHMSMYAVNSSVPKTLVKYLVEAVGTIEGGELKEVLDDVLSTEISPELLPPDKDGKIAQKTEDLVGPYELHDFYLYYSIRWGFEPKKVYYLATETFNNKYEKDVLLKWLKNFYRRFFNQQFKRSCIPDGVKIGSVTLSPRADWRMPSDAQVNIWLNELEKI